MDPMDTRREARFESMYRKSRSAQLWRRHKELEELCVKKIREHERYTRRAIVDISRQQLATSIRTKRLERAKALLAKTSALKPESSQPEVRLPALRAHAGMVLPPPCAEVTSGKDGGKIPVTARGDEDRRRRLIEWISDSRYMFSVSSRQGRDTYLFLADRARSRESQTPHASRQSASGTVADRPRIQVPQDHRASRQTLSGCVADRHSL